MWIVTQVMLLRILNSLYEVLASVQSNKPLEFVWIGLYQGPTGQLGPLSTMADITEANYDGYVRQEVVWYPAYVSSLGNPHLEGASQHYSPNGAVVTNVVTGVFMCDSQTGGTLLASYRLPGVGIPLLGGQSALNVDAAWEMSQTGNYGAPEVTS